jgi:hypothetical protein
MSNGGLVFQCGSHLHQVSDISCNRMVNGRDSVSLPRIHMDEIFKRSTMESTSTLFEKVIPVRITKCASEDRQMDLTIRFIMGVNKLHRNAKVTVLVLKSGIRKVL